MLFILIASSCQPQNAHSDGRDPYTEFFTGIEAINQSGLPDGIKVEKYAQLVALTGITTEMARDRLKWLRNRPQQWKKLLEAGITLSDWQPDTVNQKE